MDARGNFDKAPLPQISGIPENTYSHTVLKTAGVDNTAEKTRVSALGNLFPRAVDREYAKCPSGQGLSLPPHMHARPDEFRKHGLRPLNAGAQKAPQGKEKQMQATMSQEERQVQEQAAAKRQHETDVTAGEERVREQVAALTQQIADLHKKTAVRCTLYAIPGDDPMV